ncbi:MFS transporter [Aliiroseovarius crassostreae]|uniref:MFS transporter n=1 Tax=Aliiroseovarius crassostreae TaxID=154981 RepID=UPI003C7D0317
MPHPPEPALRTLLLGQVPADFSDWLDFVAIGALLAFGWQVDPIVFALLAVALGLPYLVVGPIAGGIVDRVDTKPVLILSNLGRAAATLSFFFAPNWQILLGLIFLRGCVDTFFTPAKQSALQALTTKDTRTRTNAISHAINQASKVVAPALGGAMLIWMTPQVVFLCNAFVSVLAAAVLWQLSTIPPAPAPDDGAAETGMFASLRRGLREVKTKRILRAALGMMATGYFAMFFYDTLIAPMTRDLGFTETQLGIALAAVGAGGVLGSAVMASIKTIVKPFRLIALAALTSSTLVMGLGWAEMASVAIPFPVFAAGFAVVGVATALSVVPYRTIIQTETSEHAIGQVTALSEAANMVALLTAPFIGALVASAFSIGAAFVLGGGVMLVVSLRAVKLRHAG